MSEIDNRRQQEAIERAREMYSRRSPHPASGFPNGYNGNMRRRTSGNNGAQENSPQSSSVNEEKPAPEPSPQPDEETAEREDSFLDVLLSDKERTLIILLLALLSEEKANTSLMLALMYIIM